MDKLVVEGGFQLNGSITSSGAKNSALPILAASILLDDPLIIRNIPHEHRRVELRAYNNPHARTLAGAQEADRAALAVP